MHTILFSRSGNGARGARHVLFDSHYFMRAHMGELVNNFTRVTHTLVLPHAGGCGYRYVPWQGRAWAHTAKSPQAG